MSSDPPKPPSHGRIRRTSLAGNIISATAFDDRPATRNPPRHTRLIASPGQRYRKATVGRRRRRISTRPQLHHEDSRSLAADPSVPLPSDPYPLKPQLRRQEAFRYPNFSSYSSRLADSDADLYRLGLLYNDECERGPGFELSTIIHREPEFYMRPSRRPKRSSLPAYNESPCLHLDLSFASLGAEVALAQATAAAPGEISSIDYNTNDTEYWQHSRRQEQHLTVIYELLEESLHSPNPVTENMEPPDLISDLDDDEFEDLMILRRNGRAASVETTTTYTSSTIDDDDAWIMLGDGS